MGMVRLRVSGQVWAWVAVRGNPAVLMSIPTSGYRCKGTGAFASAWGRGHSRGERPLTASRVPGMPATLPPTAFGTIDWLPTLPDDWNALQIVAVILCFAVPLLAWVLLFRQVARFVAFFRSGKPASRSDRPGSRTAVLLKE